MLVYPVTDDSALIKALLFFNSVSVFGFVCFSISFLSWKYFLYPNYCFVKLKVVFFFDIHTDLDKQQSGCAFSIVLLPVCVLTCAYWAELSPRSSSLHTI